MQCADGVVIETTLVPPEQHCKYSVDYLFRSVSDMYGPRVLGVTMIGMGSDGTDGLAAMKAKRSAHFGPRRVESHVVCHAG